LVTSSVGVLDRNVPLYRPLLLGDLLMPGNRLPDGSPCTMFERPTAGQGHLVVNEGLFSRRLTEQVAELASSIGAPAAATVVFAFSEGPRTKTAAENRMWATLGAHVNSMSVGPEVVLANELEIPCAGLAVGHKYSVPDIEAPADPGTVADTLEESRRVLDRLVFEFLRRGQPVPFGNHLFRFGDAEE
jgi:purine nucleoside phosphorylase